MLSGAVGHRVIFFVEFMRRCNNNTFIGVCRKSVDKNMGILKFRNNERLHE